MALGKNMKVDKLIPVPEKKDSNVNESNDISLPEFDLDMSMPEDQGAEIAGFDLTLDEPIEAEVSADASFELDLSEPSEDVVFDLSLSDEVNEQVEQPVLEAVVEPVIEVKIEQTEVPSIPVFENIEQENLKVEFKPSKRKTQKRIIISIEGDISINNIEVLCSKVTAVFGYYDFVELNLTNITAVDLSSIQLFHAMRVCYYPMNKFVSINAEFNRDDRKLLNLCGFTEFQTQVTANV